MTNPIECLVCGKVANGLFDPIDRQECARLRERGWQVSVAHDEAVCPGCMRDVHEDSEESPLSLGFLTWEQLKAVARVSGDEHTHKPQPETGNVPGVVAHLASMLNLDPREAERPITELEKLDKRVAEYGWQRVEAGCACASAPHNYEGPQSDCPKHGNDGDHLLAGDVGPVTKQVHTVPAPHLADEARADVFLVDGEPSSFQDADDDTWYRNADGGYRMMGLGNCHDAQSSLRAAVEHGGLQPGESCVLDALQRERDILEYKRRAEKLQERIHELEGQNTEMVRRIEEQDDELDRLTEAEQRSTRRADEAEHQYQRHRDILRNQAFALDEQDDRVHTLQNEIARVVAERNELQETVQSKIQQQDEVRSMKEGTQERVAYLEKTLKAIEENHRPDEDADGRASCPVCGTNSECLTHELAGAVYDCGRPFSSGDVLLSRLRCVRSKSHLGLHRDTAERADARYEWDNDGNVM